MKRGPFFAEIDFYNLLCIIPSAAGVGHKDCLVQTKDGDRNQIPDEEEFADACKREGREKHREEDIEHASLGIACANRNYAFAVFDRGACGGAVEANVRFNKLDGSVRTCYDRLG